MHVLKPALTSNRELGQQRPDSGQRYVEFAIGDNRCQWPQVHSSDREIAMNWSGGALKATVGAGGLCAMTTWLEFLHPEKISDPGIGFWLWISGAFVPFLIFLFVRSDEMPERVVSIAHNIAAVWYLLLVVATIGLMAYRGFQGVDLLLGFFMGLGLVPCYKAFTAANVIPPE